MCIFADLKFSQTAYLTLRDLFMIYKLHQITSGGKLCLLGSHIGKNETGASRIIPLVCPVVYRHLLILFSKSSFVFGRYER